MRVVRRDTQVLIAKQQIYAQLAKTAIRANTKVWQLGVVRWKIVGVTVHRDTRVLIAR